MNRESDYLKTEAIRVSKLFAAKHRAGFRSREAFVKWYTDQLISQSFCCYYCGVSIFDIKDLIAAGRLLTRKVKGNGRRGPVLEVDKAINHHGYGAGNCVLACYYCNNDKSYTLDGEAYKTFFGPSRKKYVEHLLKKVDPK